jgi:predicted tellurium resistance membrane protein TerC
MEILTDPQAWLALATLLALEIVLGVDNVVFISILAGKLPAHQRQRARTLGLALALITRILLLLSLSWIIRLTAPLFAVFGHEISGRDLILIIGGLFLLAKSTHEMHQRLEGAEGESSTRVAPSFGAVIVQILLLDIVFSLDSVITAVGMVDQLSIMITAVILALVVMLVFAGKISGFVENHPTIKMLALAFLLLIGTTLIAEGFGQHISKGYIYFAMAFSLFVEVLNLRARGKAADKVVLHHPIQRTQPIEGRVKEL